jgi:CheY-like chemotaxis protein
VVDDDPFIRDLVSDLLVDQGYAVDTAQNGAVAIERVQRHQPDAIVLDLMMPVMDGWQFVETCYPDGPCDDIPAVVLSAAHDLPAATRDLRRRGVRAVLGKPFALGDLLATVERVAPPDTPIPRS